MSDFTRFTADNDLEYDERASDRLGKPYYRVNTPFRYYIGSANSDRWVDVPKGFLTDGASVPKVIQWLLNPFGEYAQAAVLHDYLCTHYQISARYGDLVTPIVIDRKEIDRIMYESMRVLDVAAWRRNLIQVGLDFYRVVFKPTK